MDCALNEGISLIKLLQKDVFNNRIEWEEILEKELYRRNNPEIVYICSKYT